eukprot:11227120-Lingulodinium_polyedra.AAC.1
MLVAPCSSRTPQAGRATPKSPAAGRSKPEVSIALGPGCGMRNGAAIAACTRCRSVHASGGGDLRAA